MDKKERINDLLFGYSTGTLSVEELNELLSYVVIDEYETVFYESMKDNWQEKVDVPPVADNDIKLEVYQKIRRDLNFARPRQGSFFIKRLAPLFIRSMAAAAVLILAFIIYMQVKNFSGRNFGNDVGPGGAKATLTLSDGQIIPLDSLAGGILAEQTGVSISKSAGGELVYKVTSKDKTDNDELKFNRLETPRGGQYELILPDGTHVWLNSASSIKYPTSFTGLKERTVEVSGEAYFEVAHNKMVPFIVISGRQKIEVMGTHFNVNAYNDEPSVKTTLLEGAVKINTEGSHPVVLRPGQQASVDAQISVKDVDLELAVAWKKGDFILKDEDFKATMRKISRWYNVEVYYDVSAPDDLELGGWVSRSKNISTVLRLMESTGRVHFKIQGRRITVTK